MLLGNARYSGVAGVPVAVNRPLYMVGVDPNLGPQELALIGLKIRI
jgi:hypothetical protein